MNTNTKKEHVVILGAGFGGLAAALALEKVRQEININVTIIDRNCFHTYHALLYEVATAPMDIKPEQIPDLEAGVCIRIKALSNIFLQKALHVIQGEVVSIDTATRRLRLKDQPDVQYDRLIVAPGSVSNDFAILGVNEFGLTLKDVPDALRLHVMIDQLLHDAAAGQHRRIVIGGGGVFGVEVAGELGHYLRQLVAAGRVKPEAVNIHILEASPTVLPGFSAAVQEAARRRLERLGVHLHLGQPIVEVTKDAVRLKDQVTHPYNVFMWCGGIKAHPLVAQLGAANRKGQIEVNARLELPSDPRVTIIGDAAAVMDWEKHLPLPQTARNAVDEGRFVADDITRQLRGAERLDHFHAQSSVMVIPVGGRWAISARGNSVRTGWVAWVERKWVDWRYFRSILPFTHAWKVFTAGGMAYLQKN